MAIDGFFVRAIVAELRENLLGGRIHKIYQPFEQELQLIIRANRINHRLFASVHPEYFSVYLTEEKTANPQQAPMFCMLLRKYLESAYIQDIQQFQNDRIIDFHFKSYDEVGVQQDYLLTFELMGRHSNIILVNETQATIIDCIKHVPISQNSYRSLFPGAIFKRPPLQDQQVNLFNLSDQQLYTFCQQNQEILASGQAHKIIQGMSKLLAQSLAYWMSDQGGSLSALAGLEKIKSLVDHPSPTLYETRDRMTFYAFRLPILEGQTRSFASLSALIHSYSHQKIHFNRILQLSGSMNQKINQLLEKNHKKIEKLANERQVAEQADLYRLKGELLNAYSHQVSIGEEEVTLDNYYNDNQPLTITLNPRLSAVENAQAYFKRYQKYRDALSYINRESKLAQEEIDYLEGIQVQLNQASLEDVESIKQELIEQGYVPQKKSSTKKRANNQSQPRRFLSSDGPLIYVGRNNQQNDELSLRKASKNHWWLHAKDIPGAHVIIESDKPSERTFEEAATLAAFYSKYSQSSNVPVDVVQVKYLHKPNGAKPGFVIYEGQHTLFVTPSEELVQRLIDNDKDDPS